MAGAQPHTLSVARMASPEKIRDLTLEKVSVAIAQIDCDAQFRRAIREAREVTTRVFGRRSTHVLVAEEATPLLLDLQGQLVNRLQRDARLFSPYRWLWFSRRLPDSLFLGRLASTIGYDRALFETAMTLGASNMMDAEVEGETARTFFRIGDSTLRHLVCLAYLSRLLSSVHVSLRWAGKGARIRIGAHGLVESLASEETRRAAELYDQRVLIGEPHFTGLGTIMASAEGARGFSLGGLIRGQPQRRVLSETSAVGSQQTFEVEANYQEALVHFGEVIRFVADEALAGLGVWTPLVAALVVLLRFALLLISGGSIQEKVPLLTLGYVATRETAFRQILTQLITVLNEEMEELGVSLRVPGSAEQVIAALESAGGSTWPLRPAPILLRTPLGYVSDFANATSRLIRELEYPAQDGDVANIRSAHFEVSVQRMIDTSAWRPDPGSADLRGRELRIAGKALTDIDAIGTRNGTLLLVSCKSIPYSGPYDAGDFRTIRNAASTVVDAVSRWTHVLATLSATPRGDNYDFSRFTKIIGTVCTPHSVYVPLGNPTAEVASGLLAAVSAAELRAWLSEEPSSS